MSSPFSSAYIIWVPALCLALLWASGVDHGAADRYLCPPRHLFLKLAGFASCLPLQFGISSSLFSPAAPWLPSPGSPPSHHWASAGCSCPWATPLLSLLTDSCSSQLLGEVASCYPHSCCHCRLLCYFALRIIFLSFIVAQMPVSDYALICTIIWLPFCHISP